MKDFYKLIIFIVGFFLIAIIAKILLLPNNDNINENLNCKINYNPKMKTYSSYPNLCVDVNKNYIANISTNFGDIKLELLTKNAPKTVNSFVFLSKSGFYDDIIFHRVIKDFVIQAGDPNGIGTGGPGYKFSDEINPSSLSLSKTLIDSYTQRGYKFNYNLNTIKITKYVLAMANSGPDTNGSQFFITLSDLPSLDGLYTPFGRVISGENVVDNIATVKTDSNDKPIESVIIKNIQISVKN